jgi:hypothetical protein
MPKRARQAHIPKKAPSRRRKARRPAVVTGSDAYLDVSGPISAAPFGSEPVAPIPLPTRDGPRPRTQQAQALRSSAARASGQLPVFERSYLVEELRRIATTAGSLLALIVILALVLR